MAEAARHARYTIQEYVRLEERSNIRHEFLDGEVFALAGGTPEHSALAARLITLLATRLADRPCRVFTSDLRVRVLSSGLDTYPDVAVICGRVETDSEDANAAVNPTLLVEVTSPATEAYDRGEKLAQYQTIPSLQAVLLVSHERTRIDVWQRASSGAWANVAVESGDQIHLTALDCTFPVAEVYRDPLAG